MVNLSRSKYVILLSLIPIMMVAAYIQRFGLNLPFWDQWGASVQLLMDAQAGKLTFNHLLSQANEHRPLFPRLIWLSLAKLTNLNVKMELWLNFGIAVWTFIFFVRRSIRIWDTEGIKWSPFLIPLVALLAFNLGQYETWLQGVQTLMLLEMACVVAGVFVLVEHTNWRGFSIALAMGVVATFSMANGLLYWLVGVCILFLARNNKTRNLKIIVWLLISLVCTIIFLTDWSSRRLDFAYLFAQIPEYILFILNFIGSPINPSPRALGCSVVLVSFFYYSWLDIL